MYQRPLELNWKYDLLGDYTSGVDIYKAEGALSIADVYDPERPLVNRIVKNLNTDWYVDYKTKRHTTYTYVVVAKNENGSSEPVITTITA